jgi:hypothetical protein
MIILSILLRLDGSVSEWSKEAVLKTVEGLRPPGVRIPPLPPSNKAVLWIQVLGYQHIVETWVSG